MQREALTSIINTGLHNKVYRCGWQRCKNYRQTATVCFHETEKN